MKEDPTVVVPEGMSINDWELSTAAQKAFEIFDKDYTKMNKSILDENPWTIVTE
jgi:hypothetical protein